MQDKPQNKILETYAEDMVSVIANDREGLVQKIIHEQEEREAERLNSSPESTRNRVLLFVGIFFFFVSCFALFYYFSNKDSLEVNVAPKFASLVFNDETQSIDVSKSTKENIIEKVLTEFQNTEIKIDGLEGFYFIEDQKMIGFHRFAALLKANLPENYTEFINENFLLGVVRVEIKQIIQPVIPLNTQTEIVDSERSVIAEENKNEVENEIVIDSDEAVEESIPVITSTFEEANLEEVPVNVENTELVRIDPIISEPENPSRKDLFILLQTRSFQDVFPVMQSWENKMFLDLHSFFGVDISADTNYLLTKDFEDGIVQNKNARILYDKDFNIVLMYVYIDDNSLVITNTEDAVREIIKRLAASKVRK